MWLPRAAAAPCAPDPLAPSCCGQQAAPTAQHSCWSQSQPGRRGHRAARHHRSPTPNAAFPPRLPRLDATSLSLSLPLSRAPLSLSHTPSRVTLHQPSLSLPLYHHARRGQSITPARAADLLGAASLHERGAARVAVAVSRARKRLLVAARLKRVQPRVAELDVDLGRAERQGGGRIAAGNAQGRSRGRGSVRAVHSVCAV